MSRRRKRRSNPRIPGFFYTGNYWLGVGAGALAAWWWLKPKVALQVPELPPVK